MRWLTLTVILCATLSLAHGAGDSVRGERLFTTQGCISCHAFNGKGGSVAADLGRQLDRGYTPVLLASTMWNHAPAMWSQMQTRNIGPASLNLQDSEDLFAFFFAARYFEKAGDAGRGKRAFEDKHCSTCHNGGTAGAKAVGEWTSTSDPMSLAETMWNHSAVMRDSLAQRHLAWPHMSAQDLTDVLVFARGQQHHPLAPLTLETGSNRNAVQLFQAKGCAVCHHGKLALDQRLRGLTLTEIAAEFWNHAPAMNAAIAGSTMPAIRFEAGEMNRLLNPIWTGQFFTGTGNPVRGKHIFGTKHCIACHGSGIGQRDFSSIRMTSVLWQHGPAMLARMKEKGIHWPRFKAGEMPDLISYLNEKTK